jgi:F-type H+-transporting ATPase subunit epsilon
VTPDRSLVHEEVDEVQLPGAEGHLGVLPGHTPLLATLAVDELWYRIGEEKHYLAIAGGFGEVLPDRVTVLAQVAERAQDIDVGRAEAAKQRAEERLNKTVDVDFERARIALLKSLIRSRVASRTRTKV